MSYDLYFYRHRDDDFQIQEAIDYLQNLGNMKVTRAKFETAFIKYENANTEVDFSLFYNPAKETDEISLSIPEEYLDTKLSANINLIRPSIFALEAMPIISDFSNQFNLLIYNPQDPKILENSIPYRYSENELIELWCKDNFSFIKGLNKKGMLKAYLPKEKLFNLWNYQKNKENICASLGDEDIFVPKMYPFENNKTKEIFTAVIWGDCINQIIPKCDFIVVGRNTDQWEQRLLKKPEKVFVIKEYNDVISKMNSYLQPYQESVSDLMIFKSTQDKEAKKIFVNFFKKEGDHKYEDVSMLRISNIYDEIK